MRTSNPSLIAAALVALTAAVALWAWINLPVGAGVPINTLGLDGVRHMGSSRIVLWLIPGISLVVTLALTFGPSRAGVAAAAQPYGTTLIAIAALLLIVEYALVGRARDPGFNVMRPVALATGGLLLAIGNYLGKARQNAVFGIRTPWTLADASVWDKTHRFTGRGMVLGGLALIALSFILHDGNALGLAIAACTAIPLIAGAIWSGKLARQA